MKKPSYLISQGKCKVLTLFLNIMLLSISSLIIYLLAKERIWNFQYRIIHPLASLNGNKNLDMKYKVMKMFVSHTDSSK